MKIELDEWGCCLSSKCRYTGTCAQHSSAGDFRTEDGFRPKLEWRAEGWECSTAGRKINVVDLMVFGERRPESMSERGFIGAREREMFKQVDYQI